MLTNITGFSKKSSTRLSNFSKIVRQGYRSFQKMFTKVTGLFKNCLATFPVFLEKMRGQNTPIHTWSCQGRYRTFRKKPGKVVELFKNCPAKLSDFLKKVQQGYRTFQKLSGKVIGLFQKSSPELPVFKKKDQNRKRGIPGKNRPSLGPEWGRGYPPPGPAHGWGGDPLHEKKKRGGRGIAPSPPCAGKPLFPARPDPSLRVELPS